MKSIACQCCWWNRNAAAPSKQSVLKFGCVAKSSSQNPIIWSAVLPVRCELGLQRLEPGYVLHAVCGGQSKAHISCGACAGPALHTGSGASPDQAHTYAPCTRSSMQNQFDTSTICTGPAMQAVCSVLPGLTPCVTCQARAGECCMQCMGLDPALALHVAHRVDPGYMSHAASAPNWTCALDLAHWPACRPALCPLFCLRGHMSLTPLHPLNFRFCALIFTPDIWIMGLILDTFYT